MTTTEPNWASHARHLADLLVEHGDIRSSQWHVAIAAVPRHRFVPRVYEQDSTGQWRAWDTEGNWDRVYSPATLVTALHDQRGYPEPASSSTNPELMVRMLEILDVRDGDRVLEIGTGTGYNAALLAHRLGDERVFSVDVDADLVALARERLAALGYRPTLAAVDGHGGLPEYAPYDRILATCAVPAIPCAWAGQLAPGGSVLADLKLATSAGNLVHLHRRSSGTLEGRFSARRASFMTIRRPNHQPAPLVPARQADGGRRRPTAAPAQPWNTAPVAWFLAHLHGLPRDVVYGAELDPDTHQPAAATLSTADGSWSRVSLTDGILTEAGDTTLWSTVEAAHEQWTALGQPDWERLGLTVTPDGHHTIWLDNPAGEHRWTITS